MGMTPIENEKESINEAENIDFENLYNDFNTKVYTVIEQQIEINRINSLKVAVTTSADLQLRNKPEVNNNNVVSEIPKGSQIEIINELVNDEWYKLFDRSNGDLYVHKNYIYNNEAFVKQSSQTLSRGGYDGKSNGNYSGDFNVFTPSGLTISELYSRLEKSYPGVKHLAEDAIAIEKQYGINAVFTMAVAVHESGNGSSSLAASGNYFGIKSGNSSWYRPGGDGSKSVYRFSEVINNISSYKGKTIRGINVAYCPDGGEWTAKVLRIMNSI
ncbi:MAG: glucosaminidase domain-containing protein [Clostridium sp.]